MQGGNPELRLAGGKRACVSANNMEISGVALAVTSDRSGGKWSSIRFTWALDSYSIVRFDADVTDGYVLLLVINREREFFFKFLMHFVKPDQTSADEWASCFDESERRRWYSTFKRCLFMFVCGRLFVDLDSI